MKGSIRSVWLGSVAATMMFAGTFGLQSCAGNSELKVFHPLNSEIRRLVPDNGSDTTYLRSSQLDPEDLEAAIEEHGIRKIINLRGHSPDEEWYREEVEVAQRYGLEHASVSLTARKLPPPETMRRLVAELNDDGPIYIHCAAGIDRTGLAGAIARVLQEQPLEDAAKQLSIWYYGRITIHNPRFQAMDIAFSSLEQSVTAGRSMDQWLQEDYPAFYDANPGWH